MSDWWVENGAEEPIYRLNRTGNPAQIFNIQWAGDLSKIEESLIANGWQVSPHSSMTIILNRISKQKKTLELPVLPQLYLDQRPVLIMVKTLQPSNSLLVLSLWDSKTTFKDSGLPLWLGNVSFDIVKPFDGEGVWCMM